MCHKSMSGALMDETASARQSRSYTGPLGSGSEFSLLANNGSMYGEDSPYAPSTRESSYVIGGEMENPYKQGLKKTA